jgi:hypothetical protein
VRTNKKFIERHSKLKSELKINFFSEVCSKYKIGYQSQLPLADYLCILMNYTLTNEQLTSLSSRLRSSPSPFRVERLIWLGERFFTN